MPNEVSRGSYIVEHTCTDVFGEVFRVLCGPFSTKEAAQPELDSSPKGRLLYMNAPRDEASDRPISPSLERSAGPCGAPCVGYPGRICHLPIGHEGRHQAFVTIQWADNCGPEDLSQ